MIKIVTIRIKLPKPTERKYLRPMMGVIEKIIRCETGINPEVYYDRDE